MRIMLLAGGAGRRLWPLSNGRRIKQDLRLFTNDLGQQISVAEYTATQLRQTYAEEKIYWLTSRTSDVDDLLCQRFSLEKIIEPYRRGTYSAIAWACMKLCLEEGMNPEEPVVVMPVDAHVPDSFWQKLAEMETLLKKKKTGIVLLGATPLRPAEDFGYIVPMSEDSDKVLRFVEKPDMDTAEELIRQGALWSCGIFCFYPRDMLAHIEANFDVPAKETMGTLFDMFPQDSFDYVVVEREDALSVVRYAGQWADIGHWPAVMDMVGPLRIGNVSRDGQIENTMLINKLDIPMLAVGVQDLIALASPDGILLMNKNRPEDIRPFVKSIERPAMEDEKRWGSFRNVDYMLLEETCGLLVRHTSLLAGKRTSLHENTNRKKILVLASGEAELQIGEQINAMEPGEPVTIARGQKHRVSAKTNVILIEIHFGDNLAEDDIVRYEKD
jgi:mannose-1-phosphate guanylyltransferase